MNRENSKKYSRVAKLIGILSGFVFVLGTSYAVFRVTTTGKKENVVSAGKLDVRIENEQNEISLGNALPQTEEDGKKNTPYTFDVVNEGTIDAMYDLYIEVNNDSTLDAGLIRYYLTVIEDGEEEKQVTLEGTFITHKEENIKKGKRAYKIDTKDLEVNKTNKYKLYLWIDYDATMEKAMNKVFKANIRVDAEQTKAKKLIRQVDASENADSSAIAYLYEDGTVVVKGTGKIKSGLSDSLKLVNAEVLVNYKKALQSLGVDTSNINDIEDLQSYLDSQDSNFKDQLNTQLTYMAYKEVLQEINMDSDKVTDYDSLMNYLYELGWLTSSTAAGQEYFEKCDNNMYYHYSIVSNNPNKIVIKDGITNIPSGLFQENESIVEVTLPNSVKSIDDYAFYNCINLKSITISSSVTSIGKSAFDTCNSLTSITIPNSVTSIGKSAFSSCSSLASVTLSNNITSIEDGLFLNCRDLTSITIPNGVTSIGASAFASCESISAITIPNSVKSVGIFAFKEWSSSQTINIDNTKDYVSTNWLGSWSMSCFANINYLRT